VLRALGLNSKPGGKGSQKRPREEDALQHAHHVMDYDDEEDELLGAPHIPLSGAAQTPLTNTMRRQRCEASPLDLDRIPLDSAVPLDDDEDDEEDAGQQTPEPSSGFESDEEQNPLSVDGRSLRLGGLGAGPDFAPEPLHMPGSSSDGPAGVGHGVDTFLSPYFVSPGTPGSGLTPKMSGQKNDLSSILRERTTWAPLPTSPNIGRELDSPRFVGALFQDSVPRASPLREGFTSAELGETGVCSRDSDSIPRIKKSKPRTGGGEDWEPCIQNWVPPASPYGLIQETLYSDPWKVLVACILLNKTSCAQVRQIIWDFFSLASTPEAAMATPEAKIAEVIRPLGLQQTRAKIIVRMSAEYLQSKWTHVTELHGIGKYAADAHALFCEGKWRSVRPDDKELRKYHEWLVSTDGQGNGLEREPAPVAGL